MIERFDAYPNLKRACLFYILLGVTDAVHHLHAAMALGQSNAMHAFWTGMILMPIAILVVLSFLHSNNKYLLWIYFAIAGLATLIPGLYHGGWYHLMRILSFMRIDGESTNLKSLFPTGDFNLWFYEVSGSLEFVAAVLSAYFLYKTMVAKR